MKIPLDFYPHELFVVYLYFGDYIPSYVRVQLYARLLLSRNIYYNAVILIHVL